MLHLLAYIFNILQFQDEMQWGELLPKLPTFGFEINGCFSALLNKIHVNNFLSEISFSDLLLAYFLRILHYWNT